MLVCSQEVSPKPTKYPKILARKVGVFGDRGGKMKLTATEVDKAKPGEKLHRLNDGRGYVWNFSRQG